jgi:hypothetical protein
MRFSLHKGEKRLAAAPEAECKYQNLRRISTCHDDVFLTMWKSGSIFLTVAGWRFIGITRKSRSYQPDANEDLRIIELRSVK